jgi:hypothetical protein
MSGGLDSALACKVIQNQGIEVHAVFIEMPWGCGKRSRVHAICAAFGVPLKVIPIGDDYLSILKKPKFGFGSAFNPCVDCHIYMVKRAAAFMQEIGAAFVFTGEVLGQRPMSQRRQCLDWVAKEAGIEGRLLRPLSAALLEPTIPEQEGIVERAKLPVIQGRSRKKQYELATKLGVAGFAQPSGGCLLTEKFFGNRLKDILARGCASITETAILGLGRYFRLSGDVYAIVGRDDAENAQLVEYALPTDTVLRATTFPGPTAIVRGTFRSDDLKTVAGIIQHFSKLRGEPSVPVDCWVKSEPEQVSWVNSLVLDEPAVKELWVV